MQCKCMSWIFTVSVLLHLLISHVASQDKVPSKIDVRLVNGPDLSQGRVEIQSGDGDDVINNPWGTICNDGFVWKINVRLVNGPDLSQGRVEIQSGDGDDVINNPWGTICNDQYEVNNKAATVICRQLGYVWGEGTPNGRFGSGATTSPIFLDELMCNGSESAITQCFHSGWAKHNCYHHEDVGAICHNTTVRLDTPSSQGNVGVVQIMHEYEWADVCDSGWNDAAATLTCQRLGFVAGRAECCSALGTSHFSNVNMSFTFNCTGGESDLGQCSNSSFKGRCDYSHRASVTCHNITLDYVNTSFALRIADGAENWGRVEVRRGGIWGLVCNRLWTDDAANVTCKQLKDDQGNSFVGGVAFGPIKSPSMPYWLVDLKCTGEEKSLENCSFSQWGEPILFSCKPAYVLCYRKTGLQLDIVGGNLPSVGRVQITYDGVPGSLCTEEWTDNDAFLVCRMKGYADGMVKTPDPAHRNVPPYYLNRMICPTLRTVYMCSSYGWRVNTDQCTESAHVKCFQEVRLSQGSESAGIVEIREKNVWVGLCYLGFEPTLARLVCSELGYATGSILPMGAFGKYYGNLARPYLSCGGNETSVTQCKYNTQVQCVSANDHYVAVSCHHDEPEDEIQFQLFGDTPDSNYGRIDVRMHYVWGEICADEWSDTEANVFCKTLGRGFVGGMAVSYGRRLRVPTLVKRMVCKGDERKFANCSVVVAGQCLTSLSAGALCYKETAPYLSLVDGGRNFGRVQITSDGVRGSVCDFQQTRVDATVICKEVNANFTEGEPYNDFPVATGTDVVLSNTACSGLERSVLKCSNNGWRYVVNPSCLDHSHDFGVYCYGKVRMTGGRKTRDYAMGRVEVWETDSDTWITICGEGFDQVDANTVCNEMGFDAARVLAPGSFGVKSVWKFYTNMSCVENGSDVLRDCTYGKGLCMVPTHNYASVLCYKQGTDPETKVYIENGYHGMVIVEQFGINGTICTDGWDNTDADVVCRENGFKGGVVLGVKEVYSRPHPVWYTNVTCGGKETGLMGCGTSSAVGLSCAISLKTAGVLCYKSSGVKIELANDKGVNHYGRVEIVYDGTRGTVCDTDWSTYDARVLCQQLGFPDGQAYRKSYYGRGEGPNYLSGLTCDSTESSLLACPHSGWGKVSTICLDHDSDAGVKCKRSIYTEQNPAYGAVHVWQDDSYYLECSDTFTSKNALVVCRNLGYQYGTKVCCSAFGRSLYQIGTTVSECSGGEANYRDCKKIVGQRCNSGQYASVVCTKKQPMTVLGPDVRTDIEEYQPGMGSGPVAITHYSTKGYMCAEDFDDTDAHVICREKGFAGGYSYKYYNEKVRNGATTDLHWSRGLSCVGNETKYEYCPGWDFGNVDGCFILSHAAVFCYKEKEHSEFGIRLMNSPHPGEGFVQVKVNGTWGSVCTRNTRISNFEATVICRQLNFKYGVELSFPDYPPLNGTVWLTNVNCVGNETSVKNCLLSGMGSRVSTVCKTHEYDMAVKCYANVRVSASELPNYGMVQVLNETTDKWVSVCDTGFDDVDAGVVCRNIGYKDGKAQCCSSMGQKLTFYNPIKVANVECTGKEKTFSECRMDMGEVTCPSGKYASIICTDVSPPVENLKVSIAENKHFGNIVVERFGVKGAVCSENWRDPEARVLCRQLGFTAGYATNGTNRANEDVILTSVKCNGTEKSLSECSYPGLSEGHGCGGIPKRAAVVCSMDNDPIQYRLADVLNGRGRAEIYFNGQWGTVCDKYWEDVDADIFCKQAGFLYGESTFLAASGSRDMPIWMSHVECTGSETGFLQCQASWDARTTSRCTHFDDAGVICYNSVQLNRGDFRTKRTNGIVEIYVKPNFTVPFGVTWHTVCADTFTDKEAEVACRVLGHDHGMAVCCSPYGYSTTPMTKYRPRCRGDEKQMTDCEFVANETSCSRQNYAAVTCYNGTQPQDTYSLQLKGSLGYTGQVVLTYLGVPGRICWTGWGDADARVVCRELGFKNGSAYYHYKSSFIYLDYNGPYWLSNVSCTGDERQLRDCSHSGFGNVTQCEDRGHYAGVICYNDADVAYRISGGNARYGRVEFSYNNQWNSICSSSWGHQEANVTCRQLGYITGDTYSGEYTTPATGKAYTVDFRCKGNEGSLNECPHEGIQESLFCDDHKDDEGVFCYTSVKLSGKQGVNSGNGTVLYYHNDRWSLVCDEGFDDNTAKTVCRELGFTDGRAICCSAYGKQPFVGAIMQNYTLHCDGDEESIDQCLKQRQCTSDHYASVVCFKDTDTVNEDSYTFSIRGKDSSKGQVAVEHLGVTGRICSRGWDDQDATVLCRSKNFKNGVSYQHSETTVLQETRGPYWLAGFDCTGKEGSLMECPHSNRTDLGNCTGYDIASVLCFNETGIEYRLVSEEGTNASHYGRVEISVGGVWGTICDRYWDRREARVFCRQLNFTDGEPMGGAHFGPGRGPIWLSHLECNGSEEALHQCPHRGFANQFTIDWWFPLTLPCQTHSDDAGVFCYKSVRFNNGPNTNAGGLEVFEESSQKWYGICDTGFDDKAALVACRSIKGTYVDARTIPGGLEVFEESSQKWYGICDTDFDDKAALVACRSIKGTYVDARTIPGSAFGNITGSIKFASVRCEGTEKQLSECKMDASSTCTSGHYVSVHCSNETIVDKGVQLRLATDTLASTVHGILEVQVAGIWGRVCLHDFDDTDAAVACRHFGYDGGVAYLHIMKNDRPVLMTNVNCTGSEQSLNDCQSQLMTPDLEHCHYASNDAGVICYHKKDKDSGFKYRLEGGPSKSVGRVEIGYDGVWGMVCSWSWQTADAKVLCRALGYKDGIVNYTTNSLLPYSKPWVTGFFCQGDEPTPMTCLNTGFNSSFLMDLCHGRRETGAYTQCFNDTIEPVNITLVGGPDRYSGRVEIYMRGADAWGTICDDYWGDEDATVVCRHLGYHGGKAVRKAGYGQGTGPIWFDNVKCFGNETSLFDCLHRGIGTHNCNHTEDVGVICQVNPPSTVVSSTTTSTTTAGTSTASSTTTTTATSTTTSTTTIQPPPPTTTSTTTTQSTTRSTRPPETTTTSTTTSTSTTTKKPPTTTRASSSSSSSTTTKSTIRSTTTSSSTSGLISSVVPDTTTTPNRTVTLHNTASAGTNIGVAIGIPIALLLILAVIIGAVMFMKLRRRKKPGYARENFDESIVSRDTDGSLGVSNQLYDLNLQPATASGLTAESSPNSGNEMRLTKNGKARYSKGLSNGSPGDSRDGSAAFANPLYDAAKELESEGQNGGVAQSLPASEEIAFPINNETVQTSNA